MNCSNLADMQVEDALARLCAQLPLKARQQSLAPELQTLHRGILCSLATTGRPPTLDELQSLVGDRALLADLEELGANDLVVLDSHSGLPVGAYPLTCESTPHRIHVHGCKLYAMCALDAVSVAPMFATTVQIDSHCHVSHTPISISMQNTEYVVATSDMASVVGIYWQMPDAVAAHSMCTQMVFLKDWPTARAWQATAPAAISLFDLHAAAAFGAAFFLPLLAA